jgi:hypothetical protein
MKNALRDHEFSFIEAMMPGEDVTSGDFLAPKQIDPWRRLIPPKPMVQARRGGGSSSVASSATRVKASQHKTMLITPLGNPFGRVLLPTQEIFTITVAERCSRLQKIGSTACDPPSMFAI